MGGLDGGRRGASHGIGSERSGGRVAGTRVRWKRQPTTAAEMSEVVERT